MKWQTITHTALLFLALSSFGCAGLNTYDSGSSSAGAMRDCNGDVPSPYPPYCHPRP